MWLSEGVVGALRGIGDIDKMKILTAFYVAMESPLLGRKRK